jgi:glutathione peroxidase-family protein
MKKESWFCGKVIEHDKVFKNRRLSHFMTKNYSEELRRLIEKYKERGFEWGKPADYLEFRNGCSKREMEKEILNFNYEDVEFVEKQKEQGETRYKLYFVYSSKTGRVYVLRFTKKIRIITVYPIGKQTLKNYKRKFKKL